MIYKGNTRFQEALLMVSLPPLNSNNNNYNNNNNNFFYNNTLLNSFQIKN